MSRLPAAVFAALVAASAGAFFFVQHLKVTTPLIAGFPAPSPAVINPRSGAVCGGVDHRRMQISFYLKHRSDDVDVYVVDAAGGIVATLATGRHMQGGAHPVRSVFVWDGREDSGTLAPDGTYFVQVSLIHQGRTVVIAPGSGGPPSPIKVETHPPAPVVSGVTPRLVPRGGSLHVRFQYTGNEGHLGTVRIYRTDLPGGPRALKSFLTPAGAHSAVWDGLIGGRRAPAGVYLVGLDVTDAACNTGRFPRALPPQPGSTRGAGVTIRYLAAQPPLTPVPAGSTAVVYVDSRLRPYRWALRRPGSARVLVSGTARGVGYALRVALPPGAAAVYELSVQAAGHRTTVPLLAAAPAPEPVLVVLPALTWQGYTAVDDTGDGVPSTLAAGLPVRLGRPLVGGLPSGWDSEAALLAHLAATHRPFDLTTDLALIEGRGPALAGHRGVILAGTERWVSASLATALRGYASRGGHVLSLGLHSLRAQVAVSGDQARDPSPLRAADVFGLRHGAFVARGGGLVSVNSDGLGLFAGTAGVFPGLSASGYEPITGADPTRTIVSSVGTSPAALSIAGIRLGSGSVVEVGIPGFVPALRRSLDAREIFAGLWAQLSG